MTYYISPPPQNPLTRIIAAIIAVFALAGAFMLGMAALLVVAGHRPGCRSCTLVTGRLDQAPTAKKRCGPQRRDGRAQKQSGDVIDAEYTVVSVQDDQDDR